MGVGGSEMQPMAEDVDAQPNDVDLPAFVALSLNFVGIRDRPSDVATFLVFRPDFVVN